MVALALLVGSSAAAAPAKQKSPDVLVVIAGLTGPRVFERRVPETIAVYQPGLLALRLKPWADLRPYVSVRYAHRQGWSTSVGVQLVLVRRRT